MCYKSWYILAVSRNDRRYRCCYCGTVVHWPLVQGHSGSKHKHWIKPTDRNGTWLAWHWWTFSCSNFVYSMKCCIFTWQQLTRYIVECVLFVPSVLWYCWLGLLTCKNRLPYNLYCVGWDVKHCSIQSVECDHKMMCADLQQVIQPDRDISHFTAVVNYCMYFVVSSLLNPVWWKQFSSTFSSLSTVMGLGLPAVLIAICNWSCRLTAFIRCMIKTLTIVWSLSLCSANIHFLYSVFMGWDILVKCLIRSQTLW